MLRNVKSEELPSYIKDHGTIIKLHLRDDASMENLEYSIKKWIVFPYCQVNLKIDSDKEIRIGYKSPKAALEDFLANDGMGLGNLDNIIVEQTELNGVTMAYALRYREYFQEYSFIEFNRRNLLVMIIIEIQFLLVYVLKVYGWLIALRDINAKRFWLL